MISVLVTGATGYIGGAVVRALRARGHRVVGTTRTPAAGYVRATLEAPASMIAAMSTVDAVVHTAFPGTADGAAVETSAVTAMLAAAGDRPFLYTSGIGVVGPTGAEPVGEAGPLNPMPWLSWRRDLELATLAAPHGLVVRPGLVYGRAGGLVLTALVGAAVATGVSAYVAPGTTAWPNIHVDDLGDLMAEVVTRAPAATVLHGVTGESTPKQVAEAIGRLVGNPVAVGLPLAEARERVPYAEWLTTHQRVGSSAAATLGWRPCQPDLPVDLEFGSYRDLLPTT